VDYNNYKEMCLKTKEIVEQDFSMLLKLQPKMKFQKLAPKSDRAVTVNDKSIILCSWLDNYGVHSHSHLQLSARPSSSSYDEGSPFPSFRQISSIGQTMLPVG